MEEILNEEAAAEAEEITAAEEVFSGREVKLLGYYNYTVVLTYIGMLMGFAGILCAVDGKFPAALSCLMLSGVCDMFDGTLAATKKRDRREKRFGIQIDSLSDLVSFGLFPAIFIYRFTESTLQGATAGGIYLLCALIRLAYFNVMEEERQRISSSGRKHYMGLPVTSIALILPLIYIWYEAGGFRLHAVFPITFTVVSAAFLLPVKIKKPGLAGKMILVFIGAAEFIKIAGDIF